MATFIKGDAVENATSYELLEKTAEGVYNSLKEASEINFDLSEINFEPGDHTLVVKAKADGYETSDPSNEVVYTVEAAPAIDPALLHENTVYDYDSTTTPVTYTLKEDTAKTYFCYDLVPVEANAEYRLQYARAGFFLDANKTVIGARVNFTSGYTDWTFVTPENCAYISASFKYEEVSPTDVSLEKK